MAGDAMATGADSDQQIPLAREAHRRNHIGHARAAGDAARMAIDRAVPDLAGGVVTGAGRQQQLAAEGFRQPFEIGDFLCCRIGSHVATLGMRVQRA